MFVALGHHERSRRRLAADMAVFCPSRHTRGTALGTNKSRGINSLRDLSQNFAKKYIKRILHSEFADFNSFEGGLPPTSSCRVLRTLRCGLGTVTQGGGLTALPWAIFLRPLRGLKHCRRQD